MNIMSEAHGDPLSKAPWGSFGAQAISKTFGDPVAARDDDHVRLPALCKSNQTSIDVANTCQLQDGKFPAQPPRENVAPVVEGDEVVTQRPYRPFNILGHCDEMRIVVAAD